MIARPFSRHTDPLQKLIKPPIATRAGAVDHEAVRGQDLLPTPHTRRGGAGCGNLPCRRWYRGADYRTAGLSVVYQPGARVQKGV